MEESKSTPVPSAYTQWPNNPGQLEIRSPGLAASGWHDHQVSLAGALEAQVAVEVAELEKLLVAHVDHRREAEDQGWGSRGKSTFCSWVLAFRLGLYAALPH